MKVSMYESYGVLCHEKESVFTLFAPASNVYDFITVDVPNVVGFNLINEPVVDCGGVEYPLESVLKSRNSEPTLCYYDGLKHCSITLNRV